MINKKNLLDRPVRVKWGTGEMREIAEVNGYRDHPTVHLKSNDGHEYSWGMHMCEELTWEEEVGYWKKRFAESEEESQRLQDHVKILGEDNKRIRDAGLNLASAALHVVKEYDGLHRLMLAVAKWARAVADEGGRSQ